MLNPAPPQVPWDTGKEQALVVKAFEAGLFTEPVSSLLLHCQQGQLWLLFSCSALQPLYAHALASKKSLRF